MFGFGAGRARIIPSGGTPYELGVVQSASAEFKVDLKELRGPYRYPIAVADGKGTASGKVSFANLWPPTLSEILAAAAPTASPASTSVGQAVINESGLIATHAYQLQQSTGLAGASPFIVGSEIVVVTVAGSPYYYTRVTAGGEAAASATAPLAGKYSITTTGSAAPILQFITADNGNTVSVTYLFTPTTTNANAIVSLGQLGMNTAPTFQLTLIGTGKNYYSNAAQQFIIVFNAVLAPSLKFDFKLDDFTMLDLDYQAFIDANGNLGSLYFVSPDA
jgi:hypothetical protein